MPLITIIIPLLVKRDELQAEEYLKAREEAEQKEEPVDIAEHFPSITLLRAVEELRSSKRSHRHKRRNEKKNVKKGITFDSSEEDVEDERHTKEDSMYCSNEDQIIKVQHFLNKKRRDRKIGDVTMSIDSTGPVDRLVVHFACYEDAEAEEMTKTLIERYYVGGDNGSLMMTPLEHIHPQPVEAAEGETFMETVKSRIMVESVVRQTRAAAKFSFDFVMLCVVAAILAAIGLATNNPVIVVASMLVSPIMGPILALTFGSVIYDWRLVKIGLLSEMLSLLMCVVCGFLVGLCFAPYGEDLGWPTGEMASRGNVVGLIIGLAIALPSGIGVALSVLGNNTASLVGVAISASLLPPAVNTGVSWAYCVAGPEGIDRARFFNIGGVSMLLCLLNIFCVYVMACVMYKIKEVVPLPDKTKFWAEDLKKARNAYTYALNPDNEATKTLLRQIDAAVERGLTIQQNTFSSPSDLFAVQQHTSNNYQNTWGGASSRNALGTQKKSTAVVDDKSDPNELEHLFAAKKPSTAWSPRMGHSKHTSIKGSPNKTRTPKRTRRESK